MIQAVGGVRPRSVRQVAPGVTLEEGTFQGARYHLLRLDRRQARVEPRPHLSPRNWGQTVSQMGRETGALAALNGTFFWAAPAGLATAGEVKNDRVAVRPWMLKKRTYYAMTPEGRLHMGETEPLGRDSQGRPLWGIPLPTWQSFRYVLGGGGRLIRDGVKASLGAGHNDEEFLPDVLARRNRSAVGFTADGGTWLLAACDEPGWTPQQTADFMLAQGAHQAMFLDGGGSTTMVVQGRVVNELSQGQERRVPTALVLTSG